MIPSPLDNKIVCDYRYISKYMAGVMALQRYALKLFYSASKYCNFGSNDNCFLKHLFKFILKSNAKFLKALRICK